MDKPFVLQHVGVDLQQVLDDFSQHRPTIVQYEANEETARGIKKDRSGQFLVAWTSLRDANAFHPGMFILEGRASEGFRVRIYFLQGEHSGRMTLHHLH